MQWVYRFGDGRAEGRADMRNLLGGKGANLAEMSNLGLPVPPGFTITTECCTHFYKNGSAYPDDLKAQVDEALKTVEHLVGKTFGDAAKPLLVSVRSGARASMPGMMDTVLNLGLNDQTVQGLAVLSGDERDGLLGELDALAADFSAGSFVLDERYDQVDDIKRARRVRSLQLAGTPDRSTLDLNALTAIGVKLVGRLAGITENGKTQFAGSLRNMCALSDLKMGRLLDLIDEWARANGLYDPGEQPQRLPPTRVEDAPRLGMDLAAGAIKTIIWATGYRPDYSWLEVPVLDRRGMIRHDGGIVAAPGMYLMGAVFLRRRKSTLIDGAGDDARELSAHLASYLDGRFARLTA